MSKLYKATVDILNKPFSFALRAKTYQDAELKANETFARLGILPAGGFFLLEKITKKKG